MERHVTPIDAMQAVVNGSGMSRRQVAIKLGFNENTLGTYSNTSNAKTKSIPGLALMARIADACGYTLQLVKGDDVIVIDPPND